MSQYIVRAPLSLTMIEWDQEQDTVTWRRHRRDSTKARSAIAPAWTSSPHKHSTHFVGTRQVRVDLNGLFGMKPLRIVP